MQLQNNFPTEDKIFFLFEDFVNNEITDAEITMLHWVDKIEADKKIWDTVEYEIQANLFNPMYLVLIDSIKK